MRSIVALIAGLLVLWSSGAAARVADGALCAAAIQQVEVSAALPRGLLSAVAVSESGRYDPERRSAAPWPWTVNSAGDGRYFATKAEAISHVDRLRRSGRRNIDVGCMQINLMYHPDAFASLEEAFEPVRNVAYGADFLVRLRDETQSWARAVERYHTADVDRGRAYRDKVYDRWQEARLEDALAVDPPRGTRMAPGQPAAGWMPPMGRRDVRSAAVTPTKPLPERRKLKPLVARRLPGLAAAPGRIVTLQPPAGRKLKPLVRQQRRLPVELVRLAPPARMLAGSVR